MEEIETEEIITRTKVNSNDRLNFLPQYCGNLCNVYQENIFRFMAYACKDYKGGFWEFYELSNGGFYMGLDTEERFPVEQLSNFYQGLNPIKVRIYQ